MNLKTRLRAAIVLLLTVSIGASVRLAAQGRQAPPPEYQELVAASQLADPALRLKEFERIKAAYPNTQYREAIEASILDAKVMLAATLDDVIALQRAFLAEGQGPARLQKPVAMAVQLLNHPRLESFDHTKVLDYRPGLPRGGPQGRGRSRPLSRASPKSSGIFSRPASSAPSSC